MVPDEAADPLALPVAGLDDPPPPPQPPSNPTKPTAPRNLNKIDDRLMK
jgi:hypothetical protein